MILTVRPRLSVQIHNRSSIRKVCDLKKNKNNQTSVKEIYKDLPRRLGCSGSALQRR